LAKAITFQSHYEPNNMKPLLSEENIFFKPRQTKILHCARSRIT